MFLLVYPNFILSLIFSELLIILVFFSCLDHYEWTTWFNVDHPGGYGDYEQLEAIRFYYRARVCETPRAIEARTTDWVPARETGEKVHADPTVGFWCLNEEQGPGRNCSNYAVRFLCPKGLISNQINSLSFDRILHLVKCFLATYYTVYVILI